MARAIPYKQAVKWLAENDDTEWLDDNDPIPSVTAGLVADIYGVETDQVTRDLKRELAK